MRMNLLFRFCLDQFYRAIGFFSIRNSVFIKINSIGFNHLKPHELFSFRVVEEKCLLAQRLMCLLIWMSRDVFLLSNRSASRHLTRTNRDQQSSLWIRGERSGRSRKVGTVKLGQFTVNRMHKCISWPNYTCWSNLPSCFAHKSLDGFCQSIKNALEPIQRSSQINFSFCKTRQRNERTAETKKLHNFPFNAASISSLGLSSR